MIELPLSVSGNDILEVAIRVARAGGEIVEEHFSIDKKVEHKGRSNIVTDVDLLSEKRMVELLRKEYPTHSILTEESGEIGGSSDYTWVIDPLDGTNNYVFGIPFFAVSVALVVGEEVLVGVVYDPLRGELFRAVREGGAFLNDVPIHVSGKPRLEDSFTGCDMGYEEDGGRQMLRVLDILWPGVHGIRIMGSAVLGLAYVACGRLGLYLHRYLYPWDSAAGILLVREAGGRFTDWKGKPAGIGDKKVIASNSAIGDRFITLMNSAGGMVDPVKG